MGSQRVGHNLAIKPSIAIGRKTPQYGTEFKSESNKNKRGSIAKE